MKTLQLYLSVLIFTLICIVLVDSIAHARSIPESTQDTIAEISLVNLIEPIQDQVAQQGLSASNLWTLSEQAGPLRWPIFVVFLLGMFLVFYKLYELLADSRESREIEDMEFRLMNVPQLIRAVSGQRETMISRLHANMLNVFQSHQAHAELHEEIANYIGYLQDRFDTFKRRIEFLSDTAGALGLLGTVWGIFAVFSQGLLDDQIILTGMGVALISTLLGLVVSIILNLSSTEIFSLFNKRLDRIAEKSDELRFRLMELATVQDEIPQGETFVPEFAPPAMVPAIKSAPVPEPVEEDDTQQNHNNVLGQLEAKPIAQVEAVFEDRFSNNSYGDSAATTIRKPLVESSVEYSSEPHDLSFINPLEDSIVGKKIRDLCLLLVDQDGEPVTDREVKLEVVEGGSMLNGEEQHITAATDENGEVKFDVYVAKKAGKQLLSAYVPDSDAPTTKVTHSFMAKAGVPRKLKQFGNNQGGAAGEILSKALKVQVLDEFENPIPEWTVTFKVDLGGGVFDNDEIEVKVKTNPNGEGVAHLRVGNEPGFNTVRAAVEGVVKELKFQAMSMA
ncbi:MAG: MotA/TolQ/ExbB proton channel family protein [Rhodothermaceae bacterium]|nr:MotA/TolQ/ExbB proton channel family protein [Rhodothermaceae bacterium]